MANGELIDARSAMDLLGVGENELQTLVARGDLRAFRSAGTMKFRRDDVMSMKTEKGTEPTIIIPASGQRKPGQSGILSAASAGPAGSGIRPTSVPAPGAMTESAQPVARTSDATGEIVFDDIELMPTDDGMQTQEATVVSSAVRTSVGGDAPTIMDQSTVGSEQTGEMTVVDDSSSNEARVSTGPAVPVQATASGARPASRPRPGSRVGSAIGSSVGPAVSRVKQQSVAVARRTATVYEVKSAHPIMTVILLLNAGVLLFIASVFGVISFKGHVYMDDPDKPMVVERILPPYLVDMSVWAKNYEGHWFGRLPGRPQDHKPEAEAAVEPPPLPPEQGEAEEETSGDSADEKGSPAPAEAPKAAEE